MPAFVGPIFLLIVALSEGGIVYSVFEGEHQEGIVEERGRLAEKPRMQAKAEAPGGRVAMTLESRE